MFGGRRVADDGHDRTAREWLVDFKWNLVDPTEEDLSALDTVMEHDEFWDWAGDKVDYGEPPRKSFLWELCRLFLIYLVAIIALLVVGWLIRLSQ